MQQPTTNVKRIESIDLLKGLVMVIMALDHVRDYFHYSANIFDPADPTQTTLPIFFTRWITHFCAPAFSFLAGASAFLMGRRKTKTELSGFLFKRGLWLVFIELTIVTFAWFFDVQFRTIGMLTIWSLGISMIVLSALVYLPRQFILIFSCMLIFGHNLLDGIRDNGNLLWEILHQQSFFNLSDHVQLMIGYPVVPWVAVMSLGYYFGAFYDKSYDQAKRKKLFNIIGFSAIVLFVFLRWTNLYGNPTDRGHYYVFSKNLISFLNPAKYPPSLMYLLMTLGGAFLFLANSENLKGRIVNFFSTFGRVPFFYYILHLYLIHLLALLFAQLSGFGWQHFILPTWISFVPLQGYGLSLLMVYTIWAAVILLLYPLCKKFDTYKQSHKEKWWLSYL
ncbi:MAG: heparan-alpha-glucosaminide N-acetyltransferase domain-containing protein [Bacteroidota bacterium]